MLSQLSKNARSRNVHLSTTKKIDELMKFVIPKKWTTTTTQNWDLSNVKLEKTTIPNQYFWRLNLQTSESYLTNCVFVLLAEARTPSVFIDTPIEFQYNMFK
jgi:hypothetical protein